MFMNKIIFFANDKQTSTSTLQACNYAGVISDNYLYWILNSSILLLKNVNVPLSEVQFRYPDSCTV